jgi:hypothetical protein
MGRHKASSDKNIKAKRGAVRQHFIQITLGIIVIAFGAGGAHGEKHYRAGARQLSDIYLTDYRTTRLTWL